MKVGFKIRIECDKTTKGILCKLAGIPDVGEENPQLEISFEADVDLAKELQSKLSQSEIKAIVEAEDDKLTKEPEETSAFEESADEKAEETATREDEEASTLEGANKYMPEETVVEETASSETETAETTSSEENVTLSEPKKAKRKSRHRAENVRDVTLNLIPDLETIAKESTSYSEFCKKITELYDMRSYVNWFETIVLKVIPNMGAEEFNYSVVKEHFAKLGKEYNTTAQVCVSKIINKTGYTLQTFFRVIQLYCREYFKNEEVEEQTEEVHDEKKPEEVIPRDSSFFEFLNDIDKTDGEAAKVYQILQFLKNAGSSLQNEHMLRNILVEYLLEDTALEKLLSSRFDYESEVLEEKVKISAIFDEYFSNVESMEVTATVEQILADMKYIVSTK